MNLIDNLLEKVKDLPFDDQVKIICDKIQEEEDLKIIDKDLKPKGPNIFLSLQVPGITEKDICFLCLEREASQKYIISIWTKQKDRNTNLKRSQVQDMTNVDSIKKLLYLFTEKISLMRASRE